MLRDPYEGLSLASARALLRDKAREASTVPRKVSRQPALGLPYGRQLDNSFKTAS
jgi:hypothetical protein